MSDTNLNGTVSRLTATVGIARPSISDAAEDLKADLISLGLEHDLDIAMLAYFGCTARRLKKAQWMTFTGHTNSGKSFVKQTIAQCMPPEELLDWTNVTDATLKRMALDRPEGLDLSQIVLERDERDEKEKDVSYMRTLLSKREATFRWIQGGFPMSVRLVGRPVLLETTTATGGMFEEDANRRLILPVNESDEKLAFITEQTLSRYEAGVEDHRREIQRAHQEIQRTLPQMDGVEIPFRSAILSAWPGTIPRTAGGRVIAQLLDLIGAVTLLRHAERRITKNFIVAELEDYRVVETLLRPIHQRIVADVPAQYMDIVKQIAKAISGLGSLHPRRTAFTRNDIMEWTGLPRSTLQRHLDRIVSDGLLAVARRGGRGVQHRYALPESWEAMIEGRPIFPSADEVASHLTEESNSDG